MPPEGRRPEEPVVPARARGVVLGSLDIVDRAGADYDEQAAIFAEDDLFDCFAALGYKFISCIRLFDLLAEGEWCREQSLRGNVDIGNLFHGRNV